MNIRIPYLFDSLFKLKSNPYREKTIIRTRVYCKQLVSWLNREHEIPIGKKLRKLKIPKMIFTNEKLQRAYLRGLFDTDGTFYGRRNNEPVIGYISLNFEYLETVRALLKVNGFNFGRTDKDLYLYNKNQIDHFFKIIKHKNEKHVLKYEIFKKTGKILKTEELIDYMTHRWCNG